MMARGCPGFSLLEVLVAFTILAMLLGALGWDQYRGKVEVLTPYFGSSGTGQINAVFPV